MKNKGNHYILAKFDVSGIQDYIFATNRLRENAGASFQVTRILEELLPEALKEAAPGGEAEILTDWKKEDELRLPEDESIMAEILYIGGGNAMVLFRDMELFRRTGEKLGRKASLNNQGIYLAAAYIETDLENFAQDRKKLNGEMEEVKHNMVRQPLYSPFPVTEQDSLSHQPVTCRMSMGKSVENMTRIQFQKREAYKDIRQCQRLFPQVGDGIFYTYPEEMDQLCKDHGEDSMIAIIHIDGNGIGDRIHGQLGKHEQYSQGVKELRRESVEIAALFQDTYRKVLQKLWEEKVFINSDKEKAESSIEKVFPLRPIILDGDDFTFLCQADLAVPAAAGFMMELMKKQEGQEDKITACAGIAFVHSHFPFYVAYSIAEQSCSQAKGRWYKQKRQQGKKQDICYLDFQIIKETEAGLSDKNKIWQKRPYALALEESQEEGAPLSQSPLSELYHTLKAMEDWPSGRLHKIYHSFLEGNVAMELIEREFMSRGYVIDDLVRGDFKDSPLFDALEIQGMCRLELLRNFLDIQ